MNDLEGIIEDCYKSDLVSDKIIKKIIEIIGQKEWQNLHDENSDVCTTMGELIITLDRIAELEKENAELKETNTHTLSQLNLDNGELIIENEKLKSENAELKKDNEGYEKDNARLVQQYNDLQKENSELKTDYDILSCSVGDFGELQEKLEEEQRKNNGLSDNLTKAKEIIKKLSDAYEYVIRYEEYADREILKQAKQFLKKVK